MAAGWAVAAWLAGPAMASSGTAVPGQGVTFSVTVNGTAPFTYQWYKDGSPVPSATRATYSIPSVKVQDSGVYRVVVANSAGSTTSDDAILTVRAQSGGAMIVASPVPATVTVGGSVSFSVTASGLGPLTYQWRKGGVAIAGANSAVYRIDTVQLTDQGSYSVLVANALGAMASAEVLLSVTGASGGDSLATPGAVLPGVSVVDSNLINLSSRMQVGSGANVAIAGFVVSGAAPKQLLIRGTGPGLAGFGVPGRLARPVLTVYSGDTVVATNAGWTQAEADRLRTTAREVGAFPLPEDGRDCALLATFPAGAYTVHLRDADGAGGVGLIELYDVQPAGAARLVNLSTRANVGHDSAILISGLVVAGPGPQRLLLRALGPGLAGFGLDGLLRKPTLVIFAGQRAITSNTGWGSAPNAREIAETAVRVGAYPLEAGSADCAILAVLEPGNYTLHVSGADGGVGLALVETFLVRGD